MRSSFAMIGLMFILLFAFSGFAQNQCSGEQLFTQKNCAGDEVSTEENQLVTLINQYRKENNLSEIPISKPLSILANRHLLDLQINVKFLTHGWSNCPYDIKNKETWNCVMDAPKRLNVDFNGNGFENLYRNLNANATPSLALEGWKKSPLHNSLLLNLGTWSSQNWEAIGVSIRGQFAAIWVGTSNSNKGIAEFKSPKGMGLSFQDVVKNLSNVVSIQKTASVVENDKWVGTSKDKSVILELYGEIKDISEANLSLKIKLDTQNQLTARNKNLVLVYLNNIFSSTEEAEKWFDANFAKILQNKNLTQNFIKNNKVMELRIDRNNYLILNAKPFRKPENKAIEIK
ncbi:MAG: hypothetical protein LUM44_16800 [Pyrinomonadaceae bacterium]|nr:hypothetical protein [Pyrinomonadaceae bacterium]